MGNLGSIHNMLRRVGAESSITSDLDQIRRADKLILPGVGAFDAAMRNLARLGLVPVLNEQVLERRIPILGICLGMQLLTRGSEEGRLSGLGWIDADTVRFDLRDHPNLRLPHMGWNRIRLCREGSILDGVADVERFYFVHTYHVRCHQPQDVLAVADYGMTFHAAVISANIVGTQFHPEKSHKFGLRVLANFAASR